MAIINKQLVTLLSSQK